MKKRARIKDPRNRIEASHYTFRGIRIDNTNYTEILERIKTHVDQKGYICLTDAGNVIAAAEDEEFRNAINHSLVSIPDGMPLAWYGRLLGSRKIERITGVQLMKKLFEQQEVDWKHYLLGDTEETIAKVIRKAKVHNPRLQITGHSPPFKKAFGEDDTRILIEKINRENPDLIWVSLGGGKQDRWMHQASHKINRGIMIGVGAAFRYYIGELTLPPFLLQKMGFQWFFRMVEEPRRWFRSQAVRKLKFLVYFPQELIKAQKNLK